MKEASGKKIAAYAAVLMAPKVIRLILLVALFICLIALATLGANMLAEGTEGVNALIEAGHTELEPVKEMVGGAIMLMLCAIVPLIILRKR